MLLDTCDPDTLNQHGTTPLIRCGKADAVECAALLLQNGCSINVQDKHGRTALHWAAMNGNMGVAKILMQHGIDMALRDVNNKTALELATSADLQDKIIEFGQYSLR